MGAVLSDDQAPTSNVEHPFRAEAASVFGSLRNCVVEVLSDLGGFNRPADLQHSLLLDKTLGRQIFKLACTAEPLGSGSVVPSRTSIGRFLDAARQRGIANRKLQNVWKAYEEFEKLIEVHAGDRVTFNSMVAAASGVDEEWLATDLQHRRNAFRAMSHTMGLQLKTRLNLAVINEIENGVAYSIATVTGFIGLRILRSLPGVRVDGIALRTLNENSGINNAPLQLSDSLDGYLLDSYSSKPLPALRLSEQRNSFGQYHEVFMDQPKIGNTGATTLLFGSLYRRIPADSRPLGIHVTTARPTEVLLFDILAAPGLAGGVKPTGSATLGHNEKFSEELMLMEGKFSAELLGTGPSALATPEIPRYADLLEAVATKLEWKIQDYNAYRIRVEFPLYHSTVTMSWNSRPDKLS